MSQPEIQLFTVPSRVVRGTKLQIVLTGTNDATVSASVKDASPTNPKFLVDTLPADLSSPSKERRWTFDTTDLPPGAYHVTVDSAKAPVKATLPVEPTRFDVISSAAEQIAANGQVEVSVQRVTPTPDQPLWIQIRSGAKRRTFRRFAEFVQLALGADASKPERTRLKDLSDDAERFLESSNACYFRYGVRGFDILKAAAEIFLLCESCCSSPDCFSNDEDHSETRRLGFAFDRRRLLDELQQYLQDSSSAGTLPYIGQILQNLSLADESDLNEFFPFGQGGETARTRQCLLELIWSYWHEEAMLVQSINAIALRFQNRRLRPTGPDPLTNFALDPLRPLNNLLWGYIQDQQHHLSLPRRAHEYVHEYGLALQGRAVGQLAPVENRSRFIDAFHHLLHAATVFYREITNQFVRPDAFPILDKLRTVHLILAEGAVNQFGDLPTTARQEMLVQQWLLAQKPMREFLQSRATIPYEEPWMGQVDAMNKLMGWQDTSVMHFQRLAVSGEMILLSIRFTDWADQSKASENAENWLRYWKSEVQNYIEAYRAVTGVDLSASQQPNGRVDATMPSLLLQRRRRPTVGARP